MRAICLRPAGFAGAADPTPDAEVRGWAEIPPIVARWAAGKATG